MRTPLLYSTVDETAIHLWVFQHAEALNKQKKELNDMQGDLDRQESLLTQVEKALSRQVRQLDQLKKV